jgi:hypothetical protein
LKGNQAQLRNWRGGIPQQEGWCPSKATINYLWSIKVSAGLLEQVVITVPTYSSSSRKESIAGVILLLNLGTVFWATSFHTGHVVENQKSDVILFHQVPWLKYAFIITIDGCRAPDKLGTVLYLQVP